VARNGQDEIGVTALFAQGLAQHRYAAREIVLLDNGVRPYESEKLSLADDGPVPFHDSEKDSVSFACENDLVVAVVKSSDDRIEDELSKAV
jgi:hypothetical protein